MISSEELAVFDVQSVDQSYYYHGQHIDQVSIFIITRQMLQHHEGKPSQNRHDMMLTLKSCVCVYGKRHQNHT